MPHPHDGPASAPPPPSRFTPGVSAVLVFLIAAVVSAGAVWRAEQIRERGRRLTVASQAADSASALERRLASTVSATYELAELTYQGHGEVAAFDDLARGIVSRHPGAAALALAPGGVITRIAPTDGNARELGRDVLRDFADAGRYRQATAPGHLTMTGPLSLAGGGRAILLHLPVYIEDRTGNPAFWGFAVALMRLPGGIGALLAPLPGRGLAYQLTAQASGNRPAQVLAASGSGPLRAPETRRIDTPGGAWTLSVAPERGYTDPGPIVLGVAVGLAFCLLMALVAYLVVEARGQQVRLARMVEQRTAEIRQAELAVRDLNANLERMVEDRTAEMSATLNAIPDLLLEMDETGRCLDVRATPSAMPLPRERLMGAAASDFLPADAAVVVLTLLRTAAETGRGAGSVIRMPSPDGDQWFELSAARREGTRGGPRRLVMLARNVTSRRRAELAAERTARALRLLTHCAGALFRAESEDWLLNEICRLSGEVGGYRMVWAGFPEDTPDRAVRPVATWGDTGGYLETARVSWSEATPAGLGPTGRAIRAGTTQVVADCDADFSMSPWREQARRNGFRSCVALPLVSRGSVLGTLTMYSGDADAFSLDEVALLEEMAAKLAFGLATIRERERRLVAEAAGKVQSDLLASITDSANDAIVMVDEQGTVAYWNPAAERIFGYAADEAIGRDVLGLLAPAQAVEALRARFERYAAGGAEQVRGQTVEATLRRKDATEFPAAVSISTLTVRDGLRVVGILRDVSDLKRYQAQLVAAKEAAESAAAARGEFLSIMSHEIRTPMNVILGLAQTLAEESAGPAQRDLVAQIRSAGGLLTGVIDDILNFSKLEAGQVVVHCEPFDLAALLDRTDNLLGRVARAKGLRWTVQAPGAIGRRLVGDDLRVQQVLNNLVSNAIKFTERGEIVVGVTVLAQADDAARLRFEVRDTGLGIGPAALQTLFRPFTQADHSIMRRFGGTGLGLSISKQLVELMGGRIGADSEPGVGSTFWFELPFGTASAPERVGPAGPSAAPARGTRLAGLSVLVVDDNALNRKVAERLLAREGALAAMAADGQEALDYLRAHPDGVHAVLMDVQMPAMDGLSATRLLRQIPGLAELPVVALTAGVLPEERRAAHEAGVDDFLAKPLDLEQMVWTLHRLTAAVGPVRGA